MINEKDKIHLIDNVKSIADIDLLKFLKNMAKHFIECKETIKKAKL
ncbi:hypothetical protein [Campylobacter pinnipediorum]|nr:hypothetical protein [Campylobacter pinnipediorum]